jgi:hypothetical protein
MLFTVSKSSSYSFIFLLTPIILCLLRWLYVVFLSQALWSFWVVDEDINYGISEKNCEEEQEVNTQRWWWDSALMHLNLNPVLQTLHPGLLSLCQAKQWALGSSVTSHLEWGKEGLYYYLPLLVTPPCGKVDSDTNCCPSSPLKHVVKNQSNKPAEANGTSSYFSILVSEQGLIPPETCCPHSGPVWWCFCSILCSLGSQLGVSPPVPGEALSLSALIAGNLLRLSSKGTTDVWLKQQKVTVSCSGGQKSNSEDWWGGKDWLQAAFTCYGCVLPMSSQCLPSVSKSPLLMRTSVWWH